MTTAAARTPAGTKTADESPQGYFGHERPEVVGEVPPEARHILDVGCASGGLGAALKRRTPEADVWGAEYVPEAVEAARQRLDHVVQADLNGDFTLDAPTSFFDAIVFADVLEHLLDPAHTLKRLLPHLAPGATLVASIPNVGHWSLLAPLLVQDTWTYTDAGLLDRTHVHLFTLTEAARMLTEAGFVDLHLARIVNVGEPPLAILEALAAASVAMGGDKGTTLQRLTAYQYILRAKSPVRSRLTSLGRA